MNVKIKLPRKLGGEVSVNLTDYGFPADMPEIAVRLAAYGLQQKRNDWTVAKLGKDASAEALRERMDYVDGLLRQGIWSERGTGTITLDSFLTAALVAAAKAQDKRTGTSDTAEGYATRAAAALTKGRAEPDSKLGTFIATKVAEWEAMQEGDDSDMDI